MITLACRLVMVWLVTVVWSGGFGLGRRDPDLPPSERTPNSYGKAIGPPQRPGQCIIKPRRGKARKRVGLASERPISLWPGLGWPANPALPRGGERGKGQGGEPRGELGRPRRQGGQKAPRSPKKPKK